MLHNTVWPIKPEPRLSVGAPLPPLPQSIYGAELAIAGDLLAAVIHPEGADTVLVRRLHSNAFDSPTGRLVWTSGNWIFSAASFPPRPAAPRAVASDPKPKNRAR